MQDSIFTKIIKGEIPCHKIYEDDLTIAFLDIHPLKPGHVLVVPKAQVDHFEELPDADYTALFATVKRVAKHLQEALQVKRAVVLVMGFDVPHAHVHIVPSNSGDEIQEAIAHIKQTLSAEPDHAALAALAKQLAI